MFAAALPPTAVALLVCVLLVIALAAGLRAVAPAASKAVDGSTPSVLSGISGQRVMVGVVVGFLTLLATRCQLKVDEIQPGRSHSVIRHEVVPIQMRGSGSYLACMKFLRSLRQSFPDIGTSLIDLKGAPGAPDTSSRFEFTLEWFTAPTVVSK